MLIAVTGSIACGKSIVCEYIESLGFKVYDCDKMTSELLSQDEEVKKEVLEEFGSKVFDKNEINHKKLGDIVFNDLTKKNKLESIIHPRVARIIQSIKSEEVCFVEVPLLYESNMENLFDKVLVVSSQENIQIERLMKRSNLTLEEAKKRIALQMSQEEKIKRADFVIINNNDLNETFIQVKKIINIVNK